MTTNARHGGALVNVVHEKTRTDYHPEKRNRKRKVWYITLECGHRNVVHTEPGQKARCPVCQRPDVVSSRTYAECKACGEYRVMYARGLCNACGKRAGRESDKPFERPDMLAAKAMRELCSEWDKRSRLQKPCGPAWWWR